MSDNSILSTSGGQILCTLKTKAPLLAVMKNLPETIKKLRLRKNGSFKNGSSKGFTSLK